MSTISGLIISGSTNISLSANSPVRYYPVTNTVAIVKFSDLSNPSVNNPIIATTFVAGQEVIGTITEVTQSSGVAVVYYTSPQFVDTPTPAAMTSSFHANVWNRGL